MPTLDLPYPAQHPAPTVKATALAYLMFERPDLDRALQFLQDFGLELVTRSEGMLFMRAAGREAYCYVVQRGPEARFLGAGWRVGSQEDLLKLAQLSQKSDIETVTWPGGGQRVRLEDPSGFLADVIFGQAEIEPHPERAPIQLNTPFDLPRINGTQRIEVAPPRITRLGHVVLEVADFQATSGWYTRHLGLIPSDVQLLPDGSPAVAFMRLDLGDTPADHHTLAMAQGVAAVYSHSAYEVVDPDAIGMGNRVLREKGYAHAWGIGRHILGSQIFDYWQDPWGDKHEHYCDGDVFTASEPVGVHPVSREAMSQWGPPMPPSFTKPKFSLSFVVAVIRNLRRSPDLSFTKLLTLARLFA